MPNEERYKQEMEIAVQFTEKGEFREATTHYKRALTNATPDKMQELIDRIRELREKEKEAPKPEKKQKEMQGFQQYTKTFNDVIGYKKHKKLMLRWIKQPLEKGNLYAWFQMPKSTGIILYGPPGTGKTLFCKALSGELGIPMKDVNVNDILDKLVGGSEKNMAKVFQDARQMQPSILFFDELDALGASRESANEFTSNDIKNTINVFLKQTSELHDNKDTQVFVISATNLPWLIDDAIKRSGRLEHFIYMGPPSLWDRRRLFAHYLGMTTANKYTKHINLTLLALATMRYSQADIEKICNGAKRRAIEGGREYITTRDVQNVLKDKDEGRGSLDEWVIKAKKTYIKSEKTVVHRTGIMGWKKQKEKIEEQGKLSEAELKVYKPLINNIKSSIRWWGVFNVIRFVARGI